MRRLLQHAPSNMPPRSRAAAALLASLLLPLLACGSDPAAPSRYSTALLAGRWRSTVECPHDGYIYDYELAATDSAGRTVVRGLEQPRACGNSSIWYPEVSAVYRARGDSVRIETGLICCTYVTGVAEPFTTRVAGQFVDSNTVRVTRRNYLGADPISVPETFTIVRE